jgi:hypothetical protein
MTDWDNGPAQDYGDDTGIRYRTSDRPMARKTPTTPAKAVRRDGTECDVMATLGIAPAGVVSPDELVSDWTPVD